MDGRFSGRGRAQGGRMSFISNLFGGGGGGGGVPPGVNVTPAPLPAVPAPPTPPTPPAPPPIFNPGSAPGPKGTGVGMGGTPGAISAATPQVLGVGALAGQKATKTL